MPILLKLYWRLDHGLKMCISFGYNPQITFFHFFHKLNLVIFTAKVNGFKVFCVGNSSYSLMLIPLKLYMCLGHGLKMSISFQYINPQIIMSLVSQVELSHYYDQSEWIQCILCWQLLLQFYADSFETKIETKIL